jgi:hypothetical protein
MEEDMNEQITNLMLYELIRDFKTDVYRRFDDIDKKENQNSEKFYKELEKLKVEILKNQKVAREIQDLAMANSRLITQNGQSIQENRSKIMNLYDDRGRVAVSFTRVWAFASFFMAIMASGVTVGFTRLLLFA